MTEEDPKPIHFIDALGRKFTLPFELVNTWSGMEAIIQRAFVQVHPLQPRVYDGRFDLIGPEDEVILPSTWSYVVKPGWEITMLLSPISAKPPGPHHTRKPPGLHHPRKPPGLHHPQKPPGPHHPQKPLGPHHPQKPPGPHHPRKPPAPGDAPPGDRQPSGFRMRGGGGEGGGGEGGGGEGGGGGGPPQPPSQPSKGKKSSKKSDSSPESSPPPSKTRRCKPCRRSGRLPPIVVEDFRGDDKSKWPSLYQFAMAIYRRSSKSKKKN